MVGRKTSEQLQRPPGKVLHGTSLCKEVEGYKPVASIPAKFETVLFQGPREKKGFGSVSRRFGEAEKDNPGPGAYVQIGDTMEYKQTDSIGKKGYGPMASRDKRWRGKRAVYSGPGPGEYNQAPEEPDRHFNRAPATSAFHPPVKPVKQVPHEEETSPGPGAYSAEDTTRTGQRLEWDATNHTHKSAFKATPHKLHLVGNLESPASTKYTLVDPWDPSSGVSKAASRTPSKAGLSSFAGRSAGMSSLAQMGPAMFLEDPKAGKKVESGPGPGSYELQYHESIRTTLERSAGKPSANFQPQEFTDRFGKSLAHSNAHDNYASTSSGVAAGLGEGVGAARISSPEKGVSAPFKSTVPSRSDYDIREAGKAPGPAFYSPQTVAKHTSHHLNARKRMVL